MKAAIIGCGFIANTHVQCLTQLGHKVNAVVGTSTEKAKVFSKKWNIPNYSTDLNYVLSTDIDSVHICTPPALHFEMVKSALNAGKHVICEKPLCLNPLEAKELVAIAYKKNLVTAVNFNVRFHDGCNRLKEKISSDNFGDICLIHGKYLQEFHILPSDHMWRYIPKLAGNMRAITEIGSHWIDIVRFVTGLEINEVCANLGKFNTTRYISNGIMYANPKEDSQKITVNSEDAAVILFRFSNNAIGSVVLSEVSHGRNNLIEIEINGTKQSAWWNSENPHVVNSAEKFTGVNSSINAFSGGFPETFTDFFKSVYDDIENGHPSKNPAYPTFFDGYINSSICDAIYESGNNNSKWTKIN